VWGSTVSAGRGWEKLNPPKFWEPHSLIYRPLSEKWRRGLAILHCSVWKEFNQLLNHVLIFTHVSGNRKWPASCIQYLCVGHVPSWWPQAASQQWQLRRFDPINSRRQWEGNHSRSSFRSQLVNTRIHLFWRWKLLLPLSASETTFRTPFSYWQHQESCQYQEY